MSNGVFLDASVIQDIERDEAIRYNIQQNKIGFDFPNGFEKIRLIEECRALNALDVKNPDNFDLIYDIMMQMLTGKPVFIYYLENGNKIELSSFVVTNRYMNLRGVGFIDEYPIVVNWMVEFIAGYLGKKYPRSLESIQATMSEREERMKSLKQEEVTIRTS